MIALTPAAHAKCSEFLAALPVADDIRADARKLIDGHLENFYGLDSATKRRIHDAITDHHVNGSPAFHSVDGVGIAPACYQFTE